MIKLGVCRGIEDAQTAYEAGFDYIECGFGQIMSLPRADFDEWKRKLADSPIPCAAMNGMLPGIVDLQSTDVVRFELIEYPGQLFARHRVALPPEERHLAVLGRWIDEFSVVHIASSRSIDQI